jgi:hypothetical protein
MDGLRSERAPLFSLSRLPLFIFAFFGLILFAALVGAVTQASSPKTTSVQSSLKPPLSSSAKKLRPKKTTAPKVVAKKLPPPAALPTNWAFAAWFRDGGEAVLSQIGNDAGVVGKDALAHDLVSLGADCRAMQNDVATAQAYPKILWSEAEGYWSTALSEFAVSSADCAAGTENFDTGLLDASGTHVDAGNAAMSSLFSLTLG